LRKGARLVAEACGDGDLVAALGAAAAEDSGAGLGGHAYEETVDLAATTAVRLKGALGHDVRPVSEDVCWPYVAVAVGGEMSGCRPWRGLEANSTASLEYIRVEENRQRNIVQRLPMEMTDPVTEGRSRILHNGWCNSKKVSQFG
jgi:hypothetical protein